MALYSPARFFTSVAENKRVVTVVRHFFIWFARNNVFSVTRCFCLLAHHACMLSYGHFSACIKKSTGLYTQVGKVYMVLTAITGVLTLFIPAYVGLRILNHFGLLHLLSLFTLWSVPTAWLATSRGDVNTHQRAMVRLYSGGIIIAGAFAIFTEGRYLNNLLLK